jgi:hypothetical protein
MTELVELTCPNPGCKMKVEGKLDISGYTGKEGQKRMTFGILADTYGLL